MMRYRWPAVLSAFCGLALTALSGCQTWTSGMTLPSGHYLEHPPQYFPPSPPFPLSRELASQERAFAAVPEGAVVGPPPVPVPPVERGGGPGRGGGAVMPEPMEK
jgi:hypothetical protein